MTRLLFFGDFAPTGFGTVTREIGTRLLERGIDVRFVSQNDVEKIPDWMRSRAVKLNSLSPMSPLNYLIDGTSTASMWDDTPYVGWKPDTALVLGDFTATRAIVGEFVPAFRSIPTFHYMPVEGVGLPPAWKELWEVVHPVAMSKFGARELAKVIGYTPPMIYHGVNVDTFYPVSPERPIVMEVPDAASATFSSKLECKKAWMGFTLEGRGVNRMPPTWILRTDRHMPRKRHNAMMRALTPLLQRHPDVALIFHCRPYDQGGYLYDATSKLPGLVRFPSEKPKEADSIVCGIEGRDYPQVIVTNAWGGLSAEGLATLYNASDIYASVSAEGFGLTIAEALACGIPAVGIDYSAVPEVIGKCGLTAPVGTLLDNEYDHYWAAIDEDKFAAQVEKLIKYPSLRESLGADGPHHIASSFSWDTAADQFADLFNTAASVEAAA